MTSRRPVIVIPARFSASASALRYAAEVSARKLIEAVYAAGGEPVVVHPDAPADMDAEQLDTEVRRRLHFADGVLLPGGGDLAPRWSGQLPHADQYDVDETQDAFDLSVARVALTDGMSLLSICRGTQVVNVARGGDLVQDMSAAVGSDHRHVVHDLKLLQGSMLRTVLDRDRLVISCYHHQSLGALGAGLRVSAYAEDGTIEAVELDENDGWYLGVQWHPEDTAESDTHQAHLFEALIEASSQRMSGEPARACH
jgi:putative glutamine amidotransferase